MQRFDQLTGLRGLLAWWVVITHTLSMSGFHPENLPTSLLVFLVRSPSMSSSFLAAS